MERKELIVYATLSFILFLGLFEITVSFAFLSILSPTTSMIFLTPAGFFVSSTVAGIISVIYLLFFFYVFRKKVFEHNGNRVVYKKEMSVFLLPFYLISGISLSAHLFYTPLTLNHVFTFIFFAIFAESTYEYIQIADLQPVTEMDIRTIGKIARGNLSIMKEATTGAPSPIGSTSRRGLTSSDTENYDELNKRFLRGDLSVDEFIKMRKGTTPEIKESKHEAEVKHDSIKRSYLEFQTGNASVDEFIEMRKGGESIIEENSKRKEVDLRPLNELNSKLQNGQISVDEYVEERKKLRQKKNYRKEIDLRPLDELHNKLEKGEVTLDEYIKERKKLTGDKEDENHESEMTVDELIEEKKKSQDKESYKSKDKSESNNEEDIEKDMQIMGELNEKFHAGDISIDEFVEKRKKSKQRDDDESVKRTIGEMENTVIVRDEDEFEEEKVQEMPSKQEVIEEFQEIQYIGPTTAEKLYESGFHTLQELKDASREELSEVEGIGIALPIIIKEELQKEDSSVDES